MEGGGEGVERGRTVGREGEALGGQLGGREGWNLDQF